MRMRNKTACLSALLLAGCLLLTACGGKETVTDITQTAKAEEVVAATMHLIKTEGTVDVADKEGEAVELITNLGLYSGYGVDTRTESYAWINLDDVKLTKMDQDSEVEVKKEGKDLELAVNRGNLFFNVTEPLEEDETMTIRTSTMMVGIRGTCGWVEVFDSKTMKVFLLEGKVSCEAGGKSETVRAGEMAVITEDNGITVSEFTANDIPAFVMEEMEEDDDLTAAILEDSGIDVFNPPDQTLENAMEAYRPIVEQGESYFPDNPDGSDMTGGTTPAPELHYGYALVQMQTESSVPALILRQNTYSEYWGDMYEALVFQYDPDSQTVIQAEGQLNEGVAAAGGYRGVLTIAPDGVGILETSWYSGTGQGDVVRATVEGETLRKDTIWSGIITDWDSSGEIEINWYDISDFGGLDNGLVGTENSFTPVFQLDNFTYSRMLSYSVDGDLIVETEYFPDEQCRIVRDDQYNSNTGLVVWNTLFSYGAEGRLLREDTYDTDQSESQAGELVNYAWHEYD